MEVTDRVMYIEQRVQMQEDEIQLLKMTMADVLKRLNISEEQTAALIKRPAKGNTHTHLWTHKLSICTWHRGQQNVSVVQIY